MSWITLRQNKYSDVFDKIINVRISLEEIFFYKLKFIYKKSWGNKHVQKYFSNLSLS